MDWWLEHGLDGIVSGVVGGLFTAVAVWLTLRHERAVKKDERARQDMAEIRQAVTRVLTAAVDANASTFASGRTDETVRAAMADMEREISVAAPLLSKVLPLGGHLTMLGALVMLVTKPDGVDMMHAGRLSHGVLRRCQAWLTDPSTYSGATQDRAEIVVHGKTVIESLLGTSAGSTKTLGEESEGD